MKMKVFIMTGWYVFIMTMSMAFNSCEVGKRDGNGGSSSTESAIVAGQPIALEGSFDGIDISGVDELTIAHGDSAQVTFHGDKEAIARFNAAIKDGVLVIKKKDNEKQRRHQQVNVHIVVPQLRKMEVAGVGSVALQDETKTDYLDIDVNGCGSLQTKGIVCDKLRIEVAGTSDIILDGVTAQDARLSANGVGSVNARFANTGELDFSANGTGSVCLKGNVKSFNKESAGVGQFDTKQLVVE